MSNVSELFCSMDLEVYVQEVSTDMSRVLKLSCIMDVNVNLNVNNVDNIPNLNENNVDTIPNLFHIVNSDREVSTDVNNIPELFYKREEFLVVPEFLWTHSCFLDVVSTPIWTVWT